VRWSPSMRTNYRWQLKRANLATYKWKAVVEQFS
jgi:hypothetical protein